MLGCIYKMQIDKQSIVLESLRDSSYLALWFLCFSLFPTLQGKIMTEWQMLLKNNIQE